MRIVLGQQGPRQCQLALAASSEAVQTALSPKETARLKPAKHDEDRAVTHATSKCTRVRVLPDEEQDPSFRHAPAYSTGRAGEPKRHDARLAAVEAPVCLAAQLAGGHAVERLLDEADPHAAVDRRRLEPLGDERA